MNISSKSYRDGFVVKCSVFYFYYLSCVWNITQWGQSYCMLNLAISLCVQILIRLCTLDHAIYFVIRLILICNEGGNTYAFNWSDVLVSLHQYIFKFSILFQYFWSGNFQHPISLTPSVSWRPGASYLNIIHICQCMGKMFCVGVEFQRVPLKFHTKYLTLKDTIFIQRFKYKSS